MRNSLLLTVAAAGLLAGATAASAAGTWVPANPPAGAESFTLFGVNDHNITTGEWVNSSGITQGFVGPFDGSDYTSFTDGGSATEPRALNDRGDITGYDVGTLVPWERLSNGTLQNITKGGANLSEVAQGINRTGTFVGDYEDMKSYLRGYVGRKFKFRSKIKLDSLEAGNLGYAGRAIDDAGDIGGWYEDASTDLQIGYLLIGGALTQVDYPSSVYTVVEGLNNNGIASGQWEDTSGVIHGFVYDIASGTFTSLDAPGATFTQVWGINNSNVVAASADVGGVIESFAYCMSSKGCPTPAAHINKIQPRASGKPPAPERN